MFLRIRAICDHLRPSGPDLGYPAASAEPHARTGVGQEQLDSTPLSVAQRD